jgi:Ras homolog enriched in brain
MASLANDQNGERRASRTVSRKIIVLGFRGVGKTSMVKQYVDNVFIPEDSYVPTIEQSFKKSIFIDNVNIKLEIIDTAGKDEYATFSRSSSVGAHGYIFVFSVNSKSSLDNLIKVRENLLNLIGNDTVPSVLVAQKCDLKQREIPDSVAEDIARQWNCPLLKISAKMNVNVSKVFDKLIRLIEKDSGLLQPESKKGCNIL